MSSTIQRYYWTDDTGTVDAPNGDGTLLTNDELQAVFDAIDEMFAGASPFDVLTIGGRLQVEGFGAHAFTAGGSGLNGLMVRNSQAGSGNYASLILGNDATTLAGAVSALSSAFTTAGYNVRDSTVLAGMRSGGISLAAIAGEVRVYSNAVERLRVWASGAISVNNTFDAGVPGLFDVQAPAPATHHFYGTGVGEVAISVWNQTAGVANFAGIQVGNDQDVVAGRLFATSSTFTAVSSSHQDAIGLTASRPGGISVAATHASGAVRFYSGGSTTPGLELAADGQLFERNRTEPSGVWVDVAYNALNYTADTGAWTVQSGDQLDLRYRVHGDTMEVEFTLVDTTTTAVGNELRIQVPGGYTAIPYNNGFAWRFDASAEELFVGAPAAPGQNFITIQRFPPSPWGSGSETIRGRISIRVTDP